MAPYVKISTETVHKVYTKIKDSIDNAMFKIPLLSCWHKIYTLHETSHTRVDWESLKLATKKAPSRQLRWAAILAAKEIPTGKLMQMRGSWPSPTRPRECGHPTKEAPHIFQCYKGDEMWDNIKKVPSSWGEQNKSAPGLIPSIIYVIAFWRKGQPLQPPPYIPTQLANTFKKQTNIGCIQALMVLISHNWAEVKNAYLRSLGENFLGSDGYLH